MKWCSFHAVVQASSDLQLQIKMCTEMIDITIAASPFLTVIHITKMKTSTVAV